MWVVTLDASFRFPAAALSPGTSDSPARRPILAAGMPAPRLVSQRFGLTPYSPHCYELFCVSQELMPFIPNHFHTLCRETPGCGASPTTLDPAAASAFVTFFPATFLRPQDDCFQDATHTFRHHGV